VTSMTPTRPARTPPEPTRRDASPSSASAARWDIDDRPPTRTRRGERSGGAFWGCADGASRIGSREHVQVVSVGKDLRGRELCWLLAELSRRDLVPAIWLPSFENDRRA
jgi:hypothetical protein